MSISASLVKQLRERTGAGMMECKKALIETEGDIEKAAVVLRKTGQAKADKKADRVAAEGAVVIIPADDGHAAVIVEVNCETDFVALQDEFIQFAHNVGKTALASQADIETLGQQMLSGDKVTVDEARQNLVAKIGENIRIRRLARIASEAKLGHYSHGKRIGVLVAVKNADDTLAKDLAMQIAASNPLVVNPDQVSAEALENERDIFTTQARESGKPQEIIEKMIEGRLNKFRDEVSLLGQPFVKDPSKKVGQLLKEKNAEVISFVRFEVGEGIEKKEDNFVEEVMSQVRER